MNEKWLIVGLGKPGKEYINTRHNAGFILIDEILAQFSNSHLKCLHDGLISELLIDNKQCIFLKPQTFMNNSGLCVYNIVKYYNIDLDHIIVIHDDMNFKIGQFKIKQSGSAGGHKGVNSIIENFDTDKFIRIKVGVDSKPNENIDLKDWVVSSFSKNDLSIIKKESPFVLDAIKLIINQDIQTAMNKYNSNEMIVK